MLLRALKSPFMDSTGNIGANDLIIALKVCSSTYPFEPSFKLSFRERFHLFYLSRNHKELLKYVMLFQTYKNDHFYGPEYAEDTGNNISKSIMNSPLELSYIINLMKMGFNYKECWSLSIGLVTWITAASNEMSGSNKTFIDPLEVDDSDFEDLTILTDDELYKVVLEDLGEVRAKEFMRKRQKNGN